MLEGGGVMVTCRRALDPRFLLGDDAPAWARKACSHLEPRSHNAMVLLDASLKPAGPPRTVPMNPRAADQDGSLLRLSSGRILLSGFSWYPFPAAFAPAVRVGARFLRDNADRPGLCYVFWGAFTRHTDDEGLTWTDHNYLPPIPGSPDIVPHKRPACGGATRGRPVEADGEVLLGVYDAGPADDRAYAASVFVSEDDGETWAYRATAAHDPGEKVAMGEPALHRCPSGRIVCFIRSTNLEDHLVTAESTDNGRTWSPWRRRDVVGHPYTPVPLPDGRVLVLYGYRHPPFGIRARLAGGDCEDLDGAPEFVLRDDGLGADLGYPWGTVLGDGKVLAVYYIYGPDGVRHIAGSVLEVS